MPEELNALASAVGDFIRYWGFRRIHGQIWTVVYLSKEPLSGADLVRQLGVSKALVNDALHELVEHDLLEAEAADGRTNLYRANPKVYDVIKAILANREAVLIQEARQRFEGLKQRLAASDETAVEASRLAELGTMIQAALLALKVVARTSDKGPLAYWKFLAQAQART